MFNVLMTSVLIIAVIVKSQDIIETRNGLIKGKTFEAPEGKSGVAYYGIPFAKPPLGDLRFARPEPAVSWDGVLEATEISPDCYQRTFPLYKTLKFSQDFVNFPPFSEDCLKLNIFVPDKVAANVKIPVMVWIYGGGFSRGGTSVKIYDGKTLSTQEEVIIVSINYRVASLGFLYLDHADAPGNVGLLDQVLALQWVQDNIASFGGDPDSVTLFGQSAGGASVVYHYLSPLSRNLFNRGIIQSGAPIPFYSYSDHEKAFNMTQTLAENLGCPTGVGEKDEILNCLKLVEPSIIIDKEPRGVFDNIYKFNPTVDDFFISDSPWVILEKGDIKKSEILIGTTKDESTLFLSLFNPVYFSPFDYPSSITSETVQEAYGDLVVYSDISYDMVRALYFDPAKDNNQNNVEKSIEFVSDVFFICPSGELEDRIRANGNNLYKYSFIHHSSYSKWPKWFGSFHGEDMYYVFGDPIKNVPEYTLDEKELSRKMMRYWANFARTGNPNESPPAEKELFLDFWPLSTETEKEYLTLSAINITSGNLFKAQICRFWTETFPKLEMISTKSKSCA